MIMMMVIIVITTIIIFITTVIVVVPFLRNAADDVAFVLHSLQLGSIVNFDTKATSPSHCDTNLYVQQLCSVQLTDRHLCLWSPTPMGCLMSTSCVESQGCHLLPLPSLLSGASVSSSCSFCLVIGLLMVHPPDLFFTRKCFQYFSLRNILFFCLPFFEQLGGDSRWCVQLAAIRHWYLPLCIYVENIVCV